MATIRLDVKDASKLHVLEEILKNLDFAVSITKEEEDETTFLLKDKVLLERIKNHNSETSSNDLVFSNITSLNDFTARVKKK